MSPAKTYPQNMSQFCLFGDMMRVTASWRPDRPWNDLPLLPPALELEPKAVLKQCVTARAELAGLQQATALIPNSAILINTLPTLEARASSEIENIVTTADELFRQLEATDSADPAAREALRYRHALLEGFGAIKDRPLSARTAEIVCTRIKGIEMSVRRVPGTALVRGDGQVVYTPPESGARLRDLLANWERFLHGEGEARDIDPLVRMAAAHYQFEAIHPFTDGNGRTGRVLNSLFLVQEGLLPLPILYLSRYIIANRQDYYRLLLQVTSENRWEPWILYMLRGVEETAAWTTQRIVAIRDLLLDTARFIRQDTPEDLQPGAGGRHLRTAVLPNSEHRRGRELWSARRHHAISRRSFRSGFCGRNAWGGRSSSSTRSCWPCSRRRRAPSSHTQRERIRPSTFDLRHLRTRRLSNSIDHRRYRAASRAAGRPYGCAWTVLDPRPLDSSTSRLLDSSTFSLSPSTPPSSRVPPSPVLPAGASLPAAP